MPSGRVAARVRCVEGKVRAVAFRNVESYILARDVVAETTRGAVRCDLSWGGACYASVPAQQLGLRVTPTDYAALIDAGRQVTHALEAAAWGRHPDDPRLDGVYGTILYEDPVRTERGLRQRNVTVFGDGQVDRSPCGSGTSARLALLTASGDLPVGSVLTHESIVGTQFEARVTETTSVAGRDAVVTEIEGRAHQTGEHLFVLDPDDELGTGFVLR